MATEQLDIFSDKYCVHCGKNPGYNQNNPVLWNGFLDKETNELVCYECRNKHYGLKLEQGHGGMGHLEVPVYATGRM